MSDFLFHGSQVEIDPEVHELINIEAARQYKKLILIPSESTAPQAIRESLSSVFQNLYAEGYPDEDMRQLNEEDIRDYPTRLSYYRRYSDPRYYKGVEYADIIESLARYRCAEAFSIRGFPANKLFVNVQPLSGAPANNAVYTALINPGDTILGMNLLHGGHLTHGSSVNRSGKLFNVKHYHVDPSTQQINYDSVEVLAKEFKPKIIIAGYSSYPWVPDWARFRSIADSVGAYLLADISHIAGMVVAGVIPSPIGFAHVITFTTHKTLCGPRGACIITTDKNLSKKIDHGVFPGEQGGPHVNTFAALATTFKLARTEQFKQLQQQILKNCKTLVDQLIQRGLRMSFGGTNTHLANLDCKTIVGQDGTPLSGDLAARILDIAGIVLNRNTIPGDKTALFASGIRFGTPWMTQRGLRENEMVQVADIMADILQAIRPYTLQTQKNGTVRAKIDFDVLEKAKLKVRSLTEKAGIDYKVSDFGYPHFYYLDDKPISKGEWISYDIYGENVRSFVNYAFSSRSDMVKPGESQKTTLSVGKEKIDGILTCVNPLLFSFCTSSKNAVLAATWLRTLSDGYTIFDSDISRRMPGPIVVIESAKKPVTDSNDNLSEEDKPYHIGYAINKKNVQNKALPRFVWDEKETSQLRRTPLYETHKKLGAKIVPFAGWEMPVWYTSVTDEHAATRLAAGLFDVSHMGVYQAEGPDASVFLDSICGNDIGALNIGESCYTHLLDPDANVIDDLLIYRRTKEKYLVVVNASNDDKNWAWITAVLDGKVLIDNEQPWSRAFGRNVIFRNLRDPKEGKDMRIDIALQGPRSRDILLGLGCDKDTRAKIIGLNRTQLCEAVIGGYDLVVSRTGYTGEKMAFELFIHPDRVVDFWNALIKIGDPLGLKANGLGARDSLRTEAGLPLYGHEMAGDLNLGVADAGFGSYVKTYKPWFIGRTAFIEREKNRNGEVIRFRFNEKGVRMAHHGDPVIDRKGRTIGVVTSCAVDMEGFLTGQAFVELKSSEEGTPIFIYQSASKVTSKAPADLQSGDKVTLPTAATIVSRFPKPAK